MPKLYQLSKNVYTLLPRGSGFATANVNIIKAKKPALIDCGSSYNPGVNYLIKILKSLKIETIKKIIITHTHMDHCQNAGKLAEKFGAEVIAHKNANNTLKRREYNTLDTFEFWELIEETYPRLFHGRLSWLYRRLIIMGYNFIMYGGTKPINGLIAVDEGDIIELGDYELEVLFTPGHSNDSISILDRQSKLLFTGDMIPWTPYIHTTIEDFRQSVSKILAYAEKYHIKFMVRGHLKPQPASVEKANYRMFLDDMDQAEKRILNLLKRRGVLTAKEMMPYIFRRSHFAHQLIYRIFMRTQLFWIKKYLQNLEYKKLIKSLKEGSKTKYILI